MRIDSFPRAGIILALVVVGASPMPTAGVAAASPGGADVLRAGAAAVDVSPRRLPAIINGGFLRREAGAIQDPLYARSLVLDDGTTRLAIVVVDSCMMPRDLLDEAKALAHEQVDIPTDRILISATHTHSAPAAMGCLGCPVDPDYAAFLPGKLAEAIALAVSDLAPAEIGSASIDDYDHTHCRRWVYRPDRMLTDPFGDVTVRANMHPGHENPNAIGPSGPVDPALTLLAVRAPDGTPRAVLANYSMHYFGAGPVSADYFGRFGRELASRLGGDDDCVVMMSQGTSGDLQWRDYGGPGRDTDIDGFAAVMADRAAEVYRAIDFGRQASIAMAETTLTLGRRVPGPERLAWARSMAEAIPDGVPRDQPEVYAKEAIHLHEDPVRELKLQALRVGGLAITAIPNEVYGLTGLKLKALSPSPLTMNIELANGAEGYIPPPEQHHLGGYTTWPARTAALEVEAEPRIVATLVGLLEQVCEQPRRKPSPARVPYADAVLAANPRASYRLEDLSGPFAVELTGRDVTARFEPGIAFYLPGPHGDGLSPDVPNRAVHVAGGRLRVEAPTLGDSYSVMFWFWNGLENDARPVAGYLYSRGPDGDPAAPGEHLGIGGTSEDTPPGALFVYNGNEARGLVSGSTALARRTWHHITYVRNGSKIRVHLDGDASPEIVGRLDRTGPPDVETLFLGGRSDRFSGLEGKLDEIAVFDRALAPEEIARIVRAAGALTPSPEEPDFRER